MHAVIIGIPSSHIFLERGYLPILAQRLNELLDQVVVCWRCGIHCIILVCRGQDCCYPAYICIISGLFGAERPETTDCGVKV